MSARQYRPTAAEWQPYYAELQRYPWGHPTLAQRRETGPLVVMEYM